MQRGGKNIPGTRRHGAKVRACIYTHKHTSTVLSTTDSCWIVVRENGCRSVCVPTWPWVGDEGYPGLCAHQPGVQLHTLRDWHVSAQNRFWLYWPWFLFCIFPHCSRLVIRFLSNSIFLENLWEKQLTKRGCACLFCFVLFRVYNFLSVMDWFLDSNQRQSSWCLSHECMDIISLNTNYRKSSGKMDNSIHQPRTVTAVATIKN